jgi:bacillithiol biosynthesis cysteine-adding enzyme BshC
MTVTPLPFRQIPHSTRLFLDYLDRASSVQSFYPRSANFLSWAADEAARINYPADRRKHVAEILERQNKSWGASAKTLDNIARLRDGACAVVTGQQVGLFGGPVFSIYKALTAVKLAQEASKLAVNCVPVFWLATEDHDLDEVNDGGVLSPDGQVERFSVPTHGDKDLPVGGVTFGKQIAEVVARAAGLLGGSETAKLLAECYRPGETFGSAFANLFARLFADLGVILLDGSDPELDQIVAPLYRQVIEQASGLNQKLMQRDEQLQAAGYHQQVRTTPTSTPLLAMRDGSRIPLHTDATGSFSIGDAKHSKEALIALTDSSPQTFSPNVLLRPVVQDYLLPTLAYVGGAAEVAYFAQAAILYEHFLNRVTPIVPRFSATLIEAKPQALLEKYKLSFTDVFQGPDPLRETIGAHLLGPNLQSSLDQAAAGVESSMAAVKEALAQLDKTLVESAQNAESKMLYQITSLRARAARAETRQSEVAERHARLLSNNLYPEKALQERGFLGVYFLAKHGRELPGQLLETIDPDCLDHQLITL